MNYTKQEIFDIIKSSAQTDAQLGQVDYDAENFDYNYPIQRWIDDYDLLEWKELGKIYTECFGINYNEQELENIMTPTKEKTLGDFCFHISKKAEKPELNPIKLFGNECQEAAIFRYLKSKINVDKKKLRPSSLISEYLHKNYGKIIFESFCLAPTLSLTIDYRENKMERLGCYAVFISLTLSFISYFLGGQLITALFIFLGFAGYALIDLGINRPPEKCELKEAKTFRELVYLIQKNSISNFQQTQ